MNIYKFDKLINETTQGFFNRGFDLIRQGKVTFNDDKKEFYMIPGKKEINSVTYKGLIQVNGTIEGLELVGTIEN